MKRVHFSKPWIHSLLFLLPLCGGSVWLRHHHGLDARLLRGTELADFRLSPAEMTRHSPARMAAAISRARRLDFRERAILRAAVLYQLDPRLLVAVAMRESRMNPEARGAAGEIGMFQIMPITARHWAEVTGHQIPSEIELFDVYRNAEISAWYLRRGMDAFAHRANPLPFALAYYNAGPTRARQWDKDMGQMDMANGEDFLPHIPFASTREYVRVVMNELKN